MKHLDATFWTGRYQEGQTGWDLGQASPPLIEFCRDLDRDSRILIPGAGNAYEWEELRNMGFKEVYVLDISPYPIERLRAAHPDHADHFILGDFFAHEQTYDLILEQTFFCALDPDLRPSYVEHMHRLSHPDGQVAGVLFDREFEKEGPPFGGRAEEYRELFEKRFHVRTLEPCYNSIAPRQGTEVFFQMRPL